MTLSPDALAAIRERRLNPPSIDRRKVDPDVVALLAELDRRSGAAVDAERLAVALVETDDDIWDIVGEDEQIGESFYRAAAPRAARMAAVLARLASPKDPPQSGEGGDGA